MQAQAIWWWMTGAFVSLVFVAMVAERRRARRRDLDRPGWVSWPLVLVLSLTGAMLCLILALAGPR
jgi:hypothetical protein